MLFALLWRIFSAIANWSTNKKSVWFTFSMEVMLWPYSQQVLAKVYQPLPIVSEKLGRPKSGKAIIVIVSPLVALMDDQVKEAAKLGLCAAQLGVHNDREIMEGNFSLIFGSPESWILNPKWRAMLASTLYQDNLVTVVVDEAHVAYKCCVCIHGFGH